MEKTRLDIALELVKDMGRVDVLATNLKASKELSVTQRAFEAPQDLTPERGIKNGLLILGVLGKQDGPVAVSGYLDTVLGMGYDKVVISGSKEALGDYEKLVKHAGYVLGRKRMVKGTATVLREFKTTEKHNSYKG